MKDEAMLCIVLPICNKSKPSSESNWFSDIYLWESQLYFILCILAYNQRIHSQLEKSAEVPLVYFICLTVEMPARSSLYSDIHLTAFSGFIMLRKKAQWEETWMSLFMVWFYANQLLFAIQYVVMMLDRLTLFMSLTSELIRITFTSRSSVS